MHYADMQPSPHPSSLMVSRGLVVWNAQGGTSSHSERTEKSWGLQVPRSFTHLVFLRLSL